MTPTSTPPAFCRDQMGFAPRTREDLVRNQNVDPYKELASRWDKAPKAKPGLLMREQMGWPTSRIS